MLRAAEKSPRHGAWTTVAPNDLAMSAESSSEPVSTTINSSHNGTTDCRHAASAAAPLRTIMQKLMSALCDAPRTCHQNPDAEHASGHQACLAQHRHFPNHLGAGDGKTAGRNREAEPLRGQRDHVNQPLRPVEP